MLSKAGKATLIKLVLQAIPMYTKSTYRVPAGVCSELDAMVRKFWWESQPNANKFVALKAWKEICKPKRLGGLGFRRFKDINSTLLAKLGWKLALGVDSLWCRVLKAKYLKRNSFFEVHKTSGMSFVWQGIISSRHSLKKRVCYKIGNGLTINPWTDPWVESLPNRIPIIKEWADTSQWCKLIDLRLEDGSDWNEVVLRHLCNTAIVEAILKIP